MNIARVVVTKQWQNLENLIESFSPADNDKYEIQNIGNEDLQIYEGTTAPTSERNGFVVTHNKSAKWTKESGYYCFVKAKYNQTTINIGSL